LTYNARFTDLISDEPQVGLGEASQPGDAGGIVISSKAVSGPRRVTGAVWRRAGYLKYDFLRKGGYGE
jgi:hypothetical protein